MFHFFNFLKIDKGSGYFPEGIRSIKKYFNTSRHICFFITIAIIKKYLRFKNRLE